MQTKGKQGQYWVWLGVAGLVAILVLVRIWSPLSGTSLSARALLLNADAGNSTVQLTVGQALDLDLVAGYSVPSSSDSGVLVEQGSRTACGGEGCWRYHFQAVKAGEADLTAQRRAVCNPGEMCPMFIFLWSMHVQVRT
jgi:hypothetical protein